MSNVLIDRVLPRRAAGGHFDTYKASYDDNAYLAGYGKTAREATLSLLKRNAELQAPTVSKYPNQVGWFTWTDHCGKVSCRKYILGQFVHADTQKVQESYEIAKFPITAEEFALDLNTLAIKYPRPEQQKVSDAERGNKG